MCPNNEKNDTNNVYSEAMKSKINLEKERNNRASSELIQSSMQRRAMQKTLLLKNLHTSVNKRQLREIVLDILPKNLRNRDDPAIVDIILLKRRDRNGQSTGENNGKAQLVVANDEISQFLLNEAFTSDGLRIRKRRMEIEEFIGSLPRRVRDSLGVHGFDMAQVAIGHSTKRGFQIKHKAPHVRFELNGRESRQISLEFNDHRLEFRLRDVAQCHISIDDENNRVILFKFIYSPVIFRRRRISKIHPYWHSYSSLGIEDREYFMELLDDEEEIILERVLDWTEHGAIGACVFYRMVGSTVRSRDDKKLLDVLRRFNIRTIVRNSRTSIDLQPRQITLENDHSMNWWPIHSIQFKKLHFSTKYLLHALLAANKLWIENFNQLEELAALLGSMATVQVDRALIDFFNSHIEISLPKWIVMMRQLRDNFMTGDDSVVPEEAEPLTRKVFVTPTKVCPLPPQADITNRIIRQYRKFRDRFIRVSFVDEHFSPIFEVKSEDIFEKRIRPLLKDGILIGGHWFKFLAFSSSQLREQSCWMYDASKRDGQPIPPTADDIRISMGNLEGIKVIGKYASRMGQAFSSSEHRLVLSSFMVHEVPDVERNGYTFSDGAGMISEDLADQLRRSIGVLAIPSAFQIRYKGAKGVLSVNRKLHQTVLLRPSMIKFEGHESHNDLEIITHSKAMKLYLNRQAITLLSSLGIEDSIFLGKLDNMLEVLDGCLTQSQKALAVLDGNGDRMVRSMLCSGFELSKEAFLMRYLVSVRNNLVIGLQTKARIEVPQGIHLIGIMDEYNVIPPNHVFLQWSWKENETFNLPSNSQVVVYRNPCLHPGDIQVLKTFDHPALHHLVNVVVFSSQGSRPNPNELSNGDLDGDVYSVIYDPSLIPAEKYPAMKCTVAIQPPNTVQQVKIDDVKNFFIEYMKNDNLGVIANAHVVWADRNPEGAKSKQCLELARLHSVAVDFAKTGIPALMPSSLRVSSYPDFMENHHCTSYVSKNVLGKVYRKSKELIKVVKATLDAVVDPDLVVPGWEDYVIDAEGVLEAYSKDLYEIMCRFEVCDEAQIISNNVVNLASKHSKSKQRGKHIKQHLGKHVKDMINSFRDEFYDDFNSFDITQEVMKKASAWYQVTYRSNSPFLSFPWVVWEVLCHIKHNKCTFS